MKTPFIANTSPPLAATASPPATTSPPTDAHVPLGLLVAYEGMICSPAPEPAPHQCPLVPTPPKRYAVSALPERPQVSARAPPGVRAARAPPVSAPVPAPHERPQVPAPSESPREPAPPEGPPDVVDFPKNIWGSGAICPWLKWPGRRQRPQRPLDRHGRSSPLLRPGGLPCLHPGLASRAPPLPGGYVMAWMRLLGEGDSVRFLNLLFFVFPLYFLSFLIWLFSCSC